MDNYCRSIETIPQFGATCWFNSILHVCLYSQELRKVLWKHFKSLKDDIRFKDDVLFNFLFFMLNNYNNLDALQKAYKQFNQSKLRSDYIFSSYINKYDKGLIEKFRNKLKSALLSYEFWFTYIYHIFTTYSINYLNISVNNDKLYIQNPNLRVNNPNYINQKLINTDILFINYKDANVLDVNQHEPLDKYKDKIEKYDELVNSIKGFAPTLFINGYLYRLDCCMLGNYNNPEHAISGITCNNEYYVIDSIGTIKKISSDPFKTKIGFTPCKILPYDWTHTDNSFFIDKCNISMQPADYPDTGNRFFNISKSSTVLVYIKGDINDVRISSANVEDVSSLKLEKKILKKNLREIYNLESLTDNEILSHINSIYNTDYNLLNLSDDMKANYKSLYEILLKKPMNFNEPQDKLRKEFFIGLINKYVSKGNVYKVNNLSDEAIFNPILYNKISSIGYKDGNLVKELILYLKLNIDDLSKLILYTEYTYNSFFDSSFGNERFYDRYIIHAIPENITYNYKFIRILYKIYIEKIVFKNRINFLKYILDSIKETFISPTKGGKMKKIKKY